MFGAFGYVLPGLRRVLNSCSLSMLDDIQPGLS
jgi:hypothetical protein